MALILALESSCDDSSVALLDGTELKGMKQRGQTVHEAYGGVVPELASRAHQEVMAGMVLALLEETGTDWSGVEAIAYTRGPGLLGSLMVGASLAKGLAGSLGLPLWGVHHLHGHLVSPFVDPEPDGAFPMLSYAHHSLCFQYRGNSHTGGNTSQHGLANHHLQNLRV